MIKNITVSAKGVSSTPITVTAAPGRDRPLSICTTVFNRHDLLTQLVKSIAAGSRQPDALFIIDHGYSIARVKLAADGIVECPVYVLAFADPGCAISCNWMIENVPDDRIFVADDIRFDERAVEIMADTQGDYVHVSSDDPKWPTLNSFSCFLMRNSCYEKVGPFDEKLSPQYLYFEDTDYRRRMAMVEDKLSIIVARGAFVSHQDGGSNSIKKYTPQQMEEHHRKFSIAATNYARKWGGGPGAETLTVPVQL